MAVKMLLLNAPLTPPILYSESSTFYYRHTTLPILYTESSTLLKPLLTTTYETEHRENLTQSWGRGMQFSDAIWWRHNKSILKIVFSLYLGAILADQREIWNRDEQYMSRDQNCNFRKFKMSNGRHFENSIISICQPWIILFRSNLEGRCTFLFPWWTFKNIEIL